MRLARVLLAAAALVPALFPATTTAAADPTMTGIFVARLEVCAGTPGDCVYADDPFHQATDGTGGLYGLGAGPPAVDAPSRITHPAELGLCVSTVGGTCTMGMSGTIGPTDAGAGAYCGLSAMRGTGFMQGVGVTFSDMVFTFTWSLPDGVVVGEAYDTIHAWWAGTVTGQMRVRSGPSAGGDCTAERPLRTAIVEGVLTFQQSS